MIIISLVLLLGGALVHFYWAIGGKWWLDKALPLECQGNKLLNPPLPLSALLGFVLLGFSYVAYSLYMEIPGKYIYYSGWTIAAIFLLRALGDFHMVGVFKNIKETTFSYYDTHVYIPLCLFIGFSFILEMLR